MHTDKGIDRRTDRRIHTCIMHIHTYTSLTCLLFQPLWSSYLFFASLCINLLFAMYSKSKRKLEFQPYKS